MQWASLLKSPRSCSHAPPWSPSVVAAVASTMRARTAMARVSAGSMPAMASVSLVRARAPSPCTASSNATSDQELAAARARPLSNATRWASDEVARAACQAPISYCASPSAVDSVALAPFVVIRCRWSCASPSSWVEVRVSSMIHAPAAQRDQVREIGFRRSEALGEQTHEQRSVFEGVTARPCPQAVGHMVGIRSDQGAQP